MRRATRVGSTKESAGSKYSMPRVAKKSTSLVKAAFITSGAPATIGQLALSIVSATNEVTWVRIGKKMYVSGFFSVCSWKSKLWMCACATLDG